VRMPLRMLQKIASFSLIAIWNLSAWAGSTANLNKEGVILNGFDPVSYFKSNQAEKGNAKFQTKQGDAVYWFVSEANKQAFLKEPSKYEPQYGGWCAYAVADSKSKVDIDPKSFIIQDGKLLVFYNGLWGNTRDKWLHDKKKDPKMYLKEADANWVQVKSKEP
jgi:YHS domain-containing protein